MSVDPGSPQQARALVDEVAGTGSWTEVGTSPDFFEFPNLLLVCCSIQLGCLNIA